MNSAFDEMMRVKAGLPRRQKVRRTKKEQREITLGAIRSELRKSDQDLSNVNFKTVQEVLDNIYRTDARCVAAQWYINATDNQWNLLKHEIKQAIQQ
jgi:hypothetical protein